MKFEASRYSLKTRQRKTGSSGAAPSSPAIDHQGEGCDPQHRASQQGLTICPTRLASADVWV